MKLKINTPHRRVCFYAAAYVIIHYFLLWLINICGFEINEYLKITVTSTVPIAAIACIYTGYAKKIGDRVYFRTGHIKARRLFAWLLAGIGGCCFCEIVNIPFYKLISGVKGFSGVSVAVPESFGEYILGILCIAFLPAVFEELFCRGAVLREYEPYGAVSAVIASSLVFSVLHMSVQSAVYTFILGVIMSTAAIRADSVLITMAFHFGVNLYSLTKLYILSKVYNPRVFGFYFEVFAAAAAILFSFAMIVFLKETRGKGKILKKKNVRYGFSISMIIIIAVYIAVQFPFFKQIFGM